MDKMIQLLKRKKQIIYEMNSIRRYIHSGDCDNSLKKEWHNISEELQNINEELKALTAPKISEFETRKLEILNLIKHHNEEILKLKEELDLVQKDMEEILV